MKNRHKMDLLGAKLSTGRWTQAFRLRPRQLSLPPVPF